MYCTCCCSQDTNILASTPMKGGRPAGSEGGLAVASPFAVADEVTNG